MTQACSGIKLTIIAITVMTLCLPMIAFSDAAVSSSRRSRAPIPLPPTSQSANPVATGGEKAPGNTDQSSTFNKALSQAATLQNKTLLNTIEKFQKSWNTQQNDREKLPQFTVNDLPNFKAFRRFPGEVEATQFYPAKDGKPGAFDIPKDKNIFLVQFTVCGGAVPCNAPGEDERAIENPSGPPECPATTEISTSESRPDPCAIDLVFVVDRSQDGKVSALLAFVITKNIFAISGDILKLSKGANAPIFLINNIDLSDYFPAGAVEKLTSATYSLPGKDDKQPMLLITGWATVRNFTFERFPPDQGCRPYAQKSEVLDVSRPNYKPLKLGKDNGIILYPPKVFDVFTLKQMLAGTAAQLAALGGFNGATINGAVGNLQGVTTDTSYIAAQVTTVARPAVVSQAVTGATASNVAGSASGTTGLSSTSGSTISCPAGTLPGIGTAGLPACVPVVTAASGTGGNPVGFTGAGNTTGGSSTLNTTNSSNGTTSNNSNSNTLNSNQQNTTTTTSGGQAGTIPSIPTAALPNAPTNIGVASQDILAEQVQLNSQITTLRLALQGALSDQYLVTSGETSGNRQQTTLGINVSLNPPSRYKHAVAEVRIWVYPMDGEPVSVVNLLPAAKSYNVAKITSSQKAFGAGAVIEPVNAGVAGGRGKTRLYLAKDTDTVALQYLPTQDKGKADDWPNGSERLGRSTQEQWRDFGRELLIWQSLSDACAEDPVPLRGDRMTQGNPVVFGWQFRPVLGADYVQSGMRQVVAQLALPGSPSQGELLAPRVFVQTRWREYNEKEQVVGPVYSGSCSVTENTEAITVQTPLRVRRVFVDDMGGGVVKVKAEGRFFASGFTAMNGPNTVSPTTFDGNSIQFFSTAASLLLADDLKLVSEDGKPTRVGTKPNVGKQCGIQSTSFTAIPRPDGNSWVEMHVKPGDDFNLDEKSDGPLSPLVLVGNSVYGLHETPFFESPKQACSPAGKECVYHFLAATGVLRAAQNYTVRDLSWLNAGGSGKIGFDPSFGALSVIGPDSANASGSTNSAASTYNESLVFSLSGADLTKLPKSAQMWNCQSPGCFEVFQGFSPLMLTQDNFGVSSETTAILRLAPQAAAPVIGLKKVGASTRISLDAPQAPAPQSPPALAVSNPQGPAPRERPSPRSATRPNGGPPARQTSFLYTTNGAVPAVNEAGLVAPTQVYDSAASISSGSLADHAVITVKAVAVSPDQMPSQVAVAKFYKNGTDLVPVFGAPAPSTYKSYRFIWHPTLSAAGNVEWDLAAPPSAAKSGVTPSGILNIGDSTELVFSGVDVMASSTAYPITFTFDNALIPNALFSYDSAQKTLKLMITSNMTAKAGHKEVVMNGYVTGTDQAAKPTQVILPFDVTRR